MKSEKDAGPRNDFIAAFSHNRCRSQTGFPGQAAKINIVQTKPFKLILYLYPCILSCPHPIYKNSLYTIPTMRSKTFIFFYILLFFFTLPSFSQSPSYIIEIELKGLPDETRLELYPVSHDREKPVSQAIVSNGSATLQGYEADPRLMRLSVDHHGTEGSLVFMTEAGKIKISADAQEVQSGNQAYYTFSNIRVEGAATDKTYRSKMAMRDTLNKDYAAFHAEYKEIMAKISEARQNKNQTALDSLTKSEEYQKLAAAERDFFQKVEQKYRALFLANKDSFWGPLLMIHTMSYLTDAQKPIYEAFSLEAKDSYYGKLVKKELYPEEISGSVPSFRLKGKDGKDYSLEQLCQDKKYILIDFWASWCGPCRKEIPNLKRLYAQYADKGFQIVSISIDKKESDWSMALQEENLQWPNFLDDTQVATAYKVRMIPAMFLIDSEGNLIEKNLRGEALAQKLEELFK